VGPQRVAQVRLGQRARTLRDEQGQQLDALRRQLDRAAGAAQLARVGVQDAVAEPRAHLQAR
jgi:hypothetical protein